MQQVAIITGAGNGIGAAAAKLLAQHGVRVAVLDLHEEKARLVAQEINQAGGQALSIRCDVGQRAQVEEAIQLVESHFGDITILVNNAGVGGPFHRVDEVSDEEWDWIMNTNLKSVFLFCRNLLPKMKERNYGRIVNIASIQGLLGSAHSSTYVASKHGMIGYTKTIAAEWGEHGITCNAICPGYVDTAMGVRPEDISDYMNRVIAKSPVKRVAQPVEIAQMIDHLVGPHSGYINGTSITMDGGISSHIGITDQLS
ncbi:acetoacetyl-CoA reductase [Brevibacillus brevis]|uniref:SDR family NAD(P)-dependent oxidoreductase n=1 Tax=Brevibacillus brevis TaxID=1393 RepID=UPI000B36C462|nr:SDR family NAD(P)-dependent oxidoreductase [Brevibacillus brevis]OUQ89092.1 acetoacetyl-CoA reductase [Brevibacillus brevis]